MPTAAEALALLQNMEPCDSDGGEESFLLQESLDSDMSSSDEMSSGSESRPPPKKKGRMETQTRPNDPNCETAKDGTVWVKEEVGRPLPHSYLEPYTCDGEPTEEVRSTVKTRLQSFCCLVSLDILDIIRKCTTEHGRRKEAGWDMSVHELMAFISILLWRGVLRIPSLADAWSTTLGFSQVKTIMARNRCQDIMRHLSFDEKDTRPQRVETDKFALVSNVWQMFVANCIKSYDPGQYITIDKQLFPTKSHCPFLQYIASKPDKFGIKFWVAYDLKSKYMCNAMPYLGKDLSRPSEETRSEDVAMKLMEPFMDKGRTVTTDNYFTSLSLAQQLLSRKTSLVGTINKTRRELPPSAKQLDCKKFTTQVFSTTDTTLTVYAPKRRKTICILSTMHSTVEIRDNHKMKPNTVTDYNTMKCGVDVMDQKVRQYTVRAATRRWPVAVFFNMIDMAAMNAHMLYRACTGVKERRVDFLANLAKELAEQFMQEKMVEKEKLLCQQPATPCPWKRAMCQVTIRCKKNHANSRCVHCHKYTCGKCRQETKWQCQKCADKSDH
nr:piggyBac transposable element-derived protein 1-like [Nothobranchius furzeri]